MMKIGILGCGHMGWALLRGILAKRYIDKRNLFVSDKDKRKTRSARSKFGVNVCNSNQRLCQICGLIILAVKPQDVDGLLPEIAECLKGKLLISICAGISTKSLEGHLPKVAVIRVMPNMPARISQAISAVSPGRSAGAKDKKAALSLLSCIGEVVQVKEQLLDAVTAISGCGPAYFFYLTESLIRAGRQLGLSRRLARRLAIKTALGSALLMDELAAEADPLVLRRQVTSKGGATEAAFKVFKMRQLQATLQYGFLVAAKRSRILRGE